MARQKTAFLAPRQGENCCISRKPVAERTIADNTMLGPAALHAGYAQIDVVDIEPPDAGQIRSTTSVSAMIAALHAWFAAQLSDHGGHAMEHDAP